MYNESSEHLKIGEDRKNVSLAASLPRCLAASLILGATLASTALADEWENLPSISTSGPSSSGPYHQGDVIQITVTATKAAGSPYDITNLCLFTTETPAIGGVMPADDSMQDLIQAFYPSEWNINFDTVTNFASNPVSSYAKTFNMTIGAVSSPIIKWYSGACKDTYGSGLWIPFQMSGMPVSYWNSNFGYAGPYLIMSN